MSDRFTMWRCGLVARENAIFYGILSFLAGIIFTFAACAPSHDAAVYQQQEVSR